MKKSSLIGHTAELYDLLVSSSRPADSVIDSFFRSRRYLGSRDRRFIAETTYGMLRHKKLVEWTLGQSAPEHEGISGSKLLCIVYLVIFGRETTGTLLREIDLGFPFEEILVRAEAVSGELRASEENVSLRYSFPEWIVEKWADQWGMKGTAALCEALNRPAPVTIRVNTLRTTVDECRKRLSESGIETEPTQFSPWGLHLARRTNLYHLQLFREGWFEIQDEGSQLLPLILDPKPGTKVVDACAGGGGKSLQIAALMNNRGHIDALDAHSYRLEGLRKRIPRSGADIIYVRPVAEGELPEDLRRTADFLLVDAPCSGLGTLRRNPGLKWRITPEKVSGFRDTQYALLAHYSDCLKPGGRMVYATCTLLAEENEKIVEEFLSGHPAFVLESPSSTLQQRHFESLANDKYFRLMPHIHGTDGFFAALMKRRD